MCSGTPMSGKIPPPLTEVIIFYSHLCALPPSCPPSCHCSSPPLSHLDCSYTWSSSYRPIISVYFLSSSALPSFLAIVFAPHLLVRFHCHGKIQFRVNPPPLYSEVTLPNEEKPVSSFLNDILLDIVGAHRNRAEYTNPGLAWEPLQRMPSKNQFSITEETISLWSF